MDWMVIGGIVIAGWAMLSVLTSERLSRSQQIAIVLANAAAEQARAASEIPTAVANDAALVGNPGVFNKKR